VQNLYGLVADAASGGERIALALLVRVEGSTPREAGAKMVVYPDGRTAGTIGGGAMEAAVVQEAVEAIAQGASRMVRYELREPESGDLGICGGAADIYIAVVASSPTLVVVGAGHVAMPVAEIGHLCGFRVVVLDDRPEMASEERFPHAAERIAGDVAETLRALRITPDTYVVIVTRGHAYDEAALRAVIGSPAAYVGMIGSRRKVRATFDRLLADGVSEEHIRRVHAPIGLDIGAQTPAEIAVSILAEMVMLRRKERDARQARPDALQAEAIRSMKLER
jgi:xanthine dehydrogenase accessory factor